MNYFFGGIETFKNNFLLKIPLNCEHSEQSVFTIWRHTTRHDYEKRHILLNLL
jgi:hypothetical protein